MLWHSLNENGNIAVYDVEWPECYIETDIPAILLEKVKDSDDLGEAHESHGVDGHRIEASIDERKYKKKAKKKSTKKSKKKKKHSLYPYVFGYHNDSAGSDYDGSDGDGGE